MHRLIPYLFPLLLLLLSGGCKKKENPAPCPGHSGTTTLPAITNCGANTFGCLVNGEVWVPEISPFKFGVYRLNADYFQGNLLVIALKDIEATNTTQVIKIRLDSLFYYGAGEYIVYGNSHHFPHALWMDYNDCGIEMYTDSINTGKITITTFDRENFIISGTFEFTVVKNGCDTIRVTEGRFDVRE